MNWALAPFNQLGLWVTLINIQFHSRCGGSEKSGFQKNATILKSIIFHTHGEKWRRGKKIYVYLKAIRIKKRNSSHPNHC